jgi:hypothetical protein
LVNPNYFLGVYFLAEKGQKFKHYPLFMKMEAIRLHEELGWSYKKITGYFGIYDVGRVKIWVRKFRKQSEDGVEIHF